MFHRGCGKFYTTCLKLLHNGFTVYMFCPQATFSVYKKYRNIILKCIGRYLIDHPNDAKLVFTLLNTSCMLNLNITTSIVQLFFFLKSNIIWAFCLFFAHTQRNHVMYSVHRSIVLYFGWTRKDSWINEKIKTVMRISDTEYEYTKHFD